MCNQPIVNLPFMQSHYSQGSDGREVGPLLWQRVSRVPHSGGLADEVSYTSRDIEIPFNGGNTSLVLKADSIVLRCL